MDYKCGVYIGKRFWDSTELGFEEVELILELWLFTKLWHNYGITIEFQLPSAEIAPMTMVINLFQSS